MISSVILTQQQCEADRWQQMDKKNDCI